MDFEEILDDIQENADELIHNKPHVLIAIVLIILLFIAGLVIVMIQSSPKKAKDVQKIEFNADAPIMIPDTKSVEEEYYPYRTTSERWSRDELERWFTSPDEKVMDQLEKSNDELVEEITGAVK